MKKKTGAMLLAICMLLGMLSGCGSKQPSAQASTSAKENLTSSAPAEETPAQQDTAPEPETSASEAEPASAQEPEYTPVSYPICEPGEISLDVYMSMAGFLPMVIPDVATEGLNGNRGVQLMEEATGVHLNWTLIDQDAYAEKFSITLAAGDYPDYFGVPDTQVSGGIDALVEQDICIDLMPMLDDCLSDFKNGIFSTNEDYRKGLISDTGHMTTIKSYENQSTMGLYIRQDWLDQLGLETPETFDELHDVLAAFKNQIPGCDYPMLLTQNWDYSNNGFVGGFDTSGYGTSSDLAYFVQDGKVQAGILSDNYKDYVQMLRDWFAEGILGEPSMNMQNMFPINEYILSNQCGFAFGQSDTLSESSKQQAGGTYDMEPIQAIVREKGDTFKLYANKGQTGVGGWAITTACEYPEEAAKVINWMWTEDGYKAMNFGVEGETYNMVDGKVQYTDLITNNPNGFNAMFNTCSEIAFFDLPFDCAMERKAATFSNEAEAKAQEVWRANTSNEMQYYGSLSVPESEQYGTIASDLATKAAETVSKFINGDKPMEEWDAFIAELESMGIDQCIELKQAAYDRYQAR